MIFDQAHTLSNFLRIFEFLEYIFFFFIRTLNTTKSQCYMNVSSGNMLQRIQYFKLKSRSQFNGHKEYRQNLTYNCKKNESRFLATTDNIILVNITFFFFFNHSNEQELVQRYCSSQTHLPSLSMLLHKRQTAATI